MKINIDTKEDSPEDIRKVISFLNTLIGDIPIESNQNYNSMSNIQNDIQQVNNLSNDVGMADIFNADFSNTSNTNDVGANTNQTEEKPNPNPINNLFDTVVKEDEDKEKRGYTITPY